MGSKSDVFEAGLLDLLFLNTNLANVGDATGLRGSTVAGSLHFGLHTADPGEAGDQNDSEVGYGSYARVAKARSGAGFTRTGSSVSPASAAAFPTGTSGAVTSAPYFGLGTDSGTGAGTLLYSGDITPPLATGNGITPQLGTGTAIAEG